MDGRTLKKFLIVNCIWTVAIMALIAFTSGMECNIWILVMKLVGLVILWFLVNVFIIVQFLKKNPR